MSSSLPERRPSLFSTSMYFTERKPKNRNWGRPGKKAINSLQSSLGEPLPALESPCTVLNTSTTAKVSHKFSRLFMQWHSAYSVCGTKRGWTDATDSWQLATTLMDTDKINLTRQVVDPGIALGPVCIQQVVATTASETWRLGVLLLARIIVSQLPASESS